VPSIAVLGADGSGRLEPRTAWVVNGSAGNTLTFDYRPESGGLRKGEVALTVPVGWTAPSAQRGTEGFVSANVGSVSVQGRTVHVRVPL
jgi:hypothetical protein